MAAIEFVRLRMDDEVKEERVEGDGLPGDLMDRSPATTVGSVVWFGGASGGEPATPGPLLASRGVTTMAAAHFGAAGLAATLRDIPVEVAAWAAKELRRRSSLDAPPAVVGVSRGSELALLAAAHFPDLFAAAIGLVPSSRIHALAGTTPDNILYRWLLHGEPVPLLSDIPTERIPGPLLLLSAEDDRIMPTPVLAARALKARGTRGHVLDRHVSYPDAGHTFFGHPGLPVVDPEHARDPATM